MEQPAEKLIALGPTEVRVTPLGIGAWAWGDRLVWGYGRGYQAGDVQGAFEASLAAGINFFDTAEVYGQGRSERLLGQFLDLAQRAPTVEPAAEQSPAAAETPFDASTQPDQRIVIATKFMPLPWRLTRGSLLRALKGSLERLGLPAVDLYQIHIPLPPISIETWANALADAVEAGLVRAVGVSNYNEEQMRRAYLTLKQRGVPLASNQVEYHLLDRKVELNGLLAVCHELEISLIAYSPLAQGVLTGKYTPQNPPPGVRGRRYGRSRLEQVQPLLNAMQTIGAAHGDKTPAQVALNWTICKGTIPIPGAKNARQARDNAGALGWRLTADEVAQLDKLSAPLQKK